MRQSKRAQAVAEARHWNYRVMDARFGEQKRTGIAKPAPGTVSLSTTGLDMVPMTPPRREQVHAGAGMGEQKMLRAILREAFEDAERLAQGLHPIGCQPSVNAKRAALLTLWDWVHAPANGDAYNSLRGLCDHLTVLGGTVFPGDRIVERLAAILGPSVRQAMRPRPVMVSVGDRLAEVREEAAA